MTVKRSVGTVLAIVGTLILIAAMFLISHEAVALWGLLSTAVVASVMMERTSFNGEGNNHILAGILSILIGLVLVVAFYFTRSTNVLWGLLATVYVVSRVVEK